MSGCLEKSRDCSRGVLPDLTPGGGGGDLVPTMPGSVCPKAKDMGAFLASRE